MYILCFHLPLSGIPIMILIYLYNHTENVCMENANKGWSYAAVNQGIFECIEVVADLVRY